MIDESERNQAIEHWDGIIDGQPMEVHHTCSSCGAILATCHHSGYADFKRCQETLKALCDECRRYPG